MMFTRLLSSPKRTAFLFGPRGTGKSTWIRQNVRGAVTYDLLAVSEQLRLSRNPSALYDELQHLQKGSWVVLDEVQKVPQLLDEAHRLIEEKKLRFLLCGSSARKLKRSGVNLLAGRAEILRMFPLVSSEVQDLPTLDRVLTHGMLPTVLTGDDPVAYLLSYVEVYLQEEIRQEALTRNFGAFARFLEVAARQNGQVTNMLNIARDAHVARQTVAAYFDILVDTLIGEWLPAWKLKRATKQVTHPKFFFFDVGVARALSGRLPYPPAPEEAGVLFETFILQEMRAYLGYSRKHYPLFFWRNYAGSEVDIVLETQKGYVAIEVKYAAEWQPKYQRGLRTFAEETGVKKVRQYGVFTGARRTTQGAVTVLPWREFLRMLWDGELLH